MFIAIWRYVGVIVCGLLLSGAQSSAAVIFREDFNVPGVQLDLSKWTTEIGAGSYLGRTQLRDWVTPGATGQFTVAGGAAQLALDTYNPTGYSLYGTHAKTRQTFIPTPSTGYALTVRMRLTSVQPGLVYGIYFYGCDAGPCATNHDELDIEIVTNYLQAGASPMKVQLNRYANEPLGAGHGPIVNLPAGFDPLAYHEWRILWRQSRVTYFLDGTELFRATTFIPQGKMQVNINAWGPAPEWPDAYSGALEVAADPASNQRFQALVDSVTVTPVVQGPAGSDLDGSGKADILWYNPATGQTSTWLMDGTLATSAVVLLADPNWKVIATPDFNGDGKADLLWYNAATGQTSVWLMNGTTATSAWVLLAHPNWKVIATPDLNGDGKADLLWYNAATGQTSVWLMDGKAATYAAVLLADPNWKVIATPDFNGDGKADLLWYNAATGQTSTWLMDGATATSKVVLLADPNWKVIATPDFNGDGKADILWYNAATGQTSTWLMDGATVTIGTVLLADPNWKVIATPDFNGDGKADILWYNAVTGQTSTWLMNGTVSSTAAVLLADPHWKPCSPSGITGSLGLQCP